VGRGTGHRGEDRNAPLYRANPALSMLMEQRLERNLRNVLLRLGLRRNPKPPPGLVERRRKIDPRFRDPKYPEFVCRRKNPFHYGEPPPRQGDSFLHPEHPARKTHLTLGVAFCVVLIALLTLVFFSLQNSDTRNINKPKGTVHPIVGL